MRTAKMLMIYWLMTKMIQTKMKIARKLILRSSWLVKRERHPKKVEAVQLRIFNHLKRSQMYQFNNKSQLDKMVLHKSPNNNSKNLNNNNNNRNLNNNSRLNKAKVVRTRERRTRTRIRVNTELNELIYCPYIIKRF
jgi:hypothetical protein